MGNSNKYLERKNEHRERLPVFPNSSTGQSDFEPLISERAEAIQRIGSYIRKRKEWSTADYYDDMFAKRAKNFREGTTFDLSYEDQAHTRANNRTDLHNGKAVDLEAWMGGGILNDAESFRAMSHASHYITGVYSRAPTLVEKWNPEEHPRTFMPFFNNQRGRTFGRPPPQEYDFEFWNSWI
eukprot:TRINITY_DN9743_c0_g1_i1.p1 TRINITY_DN9743_c0_g1~~TRINITY_DN9743_c0_g1_i1.p1  ORF type:complete len:196 (+),score=36.73 TRINITY_DN9743_c0_g1_i1:45-590(+)